LGVTLRGQGDLGGRRFPTGGAQFAAAVVAALLVVFIKPVAGPVVPPPGAPVRIQHCRQACSSSSCSPFALVYVVLNSATAKGTAGNSFLWAGDRLHGRGGCVCRRGRWSGGAFKPGCLRLGVATAGTSREWGQHLDPPGPPNFAGGAAAALLFNALDNGAGTGA